MKRIQLHFAVLAGVLSAAWHRTFKPDAIALGNALATMPGPGDSKLIDEAIGRWKIVTVGSDEDHIALCDKGGIPSGFTRDDSGTTAEDRVAYELFGLSSTAAQATASGAITAGHLVCPGDNGVLRDVTLVTTETVYVCGLALTTVATGAIVTFVPYAPVQRVIS